MKAMIQRRVTEVWKSAIFLGVMALSDNFTVTVQSEVLKVSTIRLADNDDSLTCVSVLQIGHLLDRN